MNIELHLISISKIWDNMQCYNYNTLCSMNHKLAPYICNNICILCKYLWF